ncbi:MAG: GyrI-like domain-containing protein [Candidatus Velamenicoccus archaeovorus]
MPKVDLKRSMRRLYFPPSGQPVLVDVPEMAFLTIDGRGAPEEKPYTDAVEALFAVSFALKFTIKRLDPEDDYTVMPLESLWWSKEHEVFDLEDRTGWRWTAMIVQPPVVTPSLVERAIADAASRRRSPAFRRIRFEHVREGLAAQLMHVGPYAEERPTIEKLHAFIAEHDYPIRGKHHEIYLSDPRRCAPARMKTVIRQPVGL